MLDSFVLVIKNHDYKKLLINGNVGFIKIGKLFHDIDNKDDWINAKFYGHVKK